MFNFDPHSNRSRSKFNEGVRSCGEVVSVFEVIAHIQSLASGRGWHYWSFGPQSTIVVKLSWIMILD